MKKLALLFILFSILSASPILAQRDLMPEVNQDMPQWVKKMYLPDADIGEVLELYEQYYAENKFEKNQHTQYLKRWLHDIGRDMDGTFSNKIKERERERLINDLFDRTEATRRRSGDRRSTNSNWTGLGPYDWDHDAASRSYAPGAAHMYVVEQAQSNPDVLYAGAATAGLWKTEDHGLNWTSLTKDLLINRVYALEIDHSDEDVVYADLYSNIYKTTDGGSSWSPTGDAAFQALSVTVRDIRMHPANTDILIAASSQGLYKTINAGLDWTLVLSGYFQEVEWHPTEDTIVYVVEQINNQTRFYRSGDTGSSFTWQQGGWPAPVAPDENKRAEIAVSPNMPDRVVALLTGKVNGGSGLYGIYISEDQGLSWTFSCCGPHPGGLPDLDTMPPNINMMGWSDIGSDNGGQYYYDLALAVSPFDADSIFVAGVNMWVSGDGGSSFICPAKWSHPAKPNYVHADIHDINYYASGEMWIACDGGIFHSTNNGADIDRKMYGIEGSDFWGFGSDFWDGDVMLGGLYHNGTLLRNGNVYINGWNCIDGGDGTGGFGNMGIRNRVYSNYNVKDLPDDRTVGIPTRGYAKKPTTHYIVGRIGNIAVHPHNYSIQYFGNDTCLYVTADDHYTAEAVHCFGELVSDVEVSLLNPDIMVVTTFPDYWAEKKIYRTADGGSNWTEITPPSSLIPSSRWIAYDAVLSDTDTNTLWIARTAQSVTNYDGAKVYRSADGGSSWTNLTTSALNGEQLTNITLQRGTNEGLYLGSRRSVFYRSGSLADWMEFNTNLPAATFSTRLLFNYRTKTIRNGTNRSIYESPVYEESSPRAFPSVDKFYSGCALDTFYFSDYSALHEDNASWSWTFPGAAFVSSDTTRQVKVVYGSPGSYDISLTVSNDYGSDQRSIPSFISIGNDCTQDTFPGKAIQLSSVGDYAQIQDLGIQSNTVTITAWVKPDGVQPDYSGIVINDGVTAGFNFKSASNMLAYHWPGGSWSWNSGLNVQSGIWSHVAMVATPESMTLYVNGIPSMHAANLELVDLAAMKIGSYKGWTSRNYKGLMDEVVIWNRSLNTEEIREEMHLTKERLLELSSPERDTTVVAYYQCNEESGLVLDKAGLHHAIPAGGLSRIPSTIAVGAGSASTQTVGEPGSYHYPDEGCILLFDTAGTMPSGDIVVSGINWKPSGVTSLDSLSRKYWVIHNFGSPATFTALDSIYFSSAGLLDENCPDHYLFTRGSMAEGDSWGDALSWAGDCRTGPGEKIRFGVKDGLDHFSQFVIGVYHNGFYVDSAATGDQSGNSWQHAFVDLQDALDLARRGDTIYVAKGTYSPSRSRIECDTCTGIFQYSFVPFDSIHLLGGYYDTQGESGAQRDHTQYLTILSGAVMVGELPDTVYHVLAIDSLVREIHMDGIRIFNGSANGQQNIDKTAPAILCLGKLYLSNSIISNHNASEGSAIYIDPSHGYLMLKNCLLKDNKSSDGTSFLSNMGTRLQVDGQTEIRLE